MKIYDRTGVQRDWNWLIATYGNLTIAGSGAWQVGGFQETEGPSVLRIGVFDSAGNPLPGQAIAFSWPDAPPDPTAGGLGRAVKGLTKENGYAEFALGRGAYYDPQRQTGPHSAWVWGQPGPVVSGLGMLRNTEHRHLDFYFQPTATTDTDLSDELPWNPKAARWSERAASAIRQIVVHHTAYSLPANTNTRDFIFRCNEAYIEIGQPRIPYHKIIGPHGVVWTCNLDTHQTNHTGVQEIDNHSLAVALLGDLRQAQPTEKQLTALRDLRRQMMLPAIAHSEVETVDCPGPWWHQWKNWIHDTPTAPTPDLDKLQKLIAEVKRLAEEAYRLVYKP